MQDARLKSHEVNATPLSNVPTPPVTSGEYPHLYSGEYFPFAPPVSASSRCPSFDGNIQGQRRRICTSGSTILCRLSRLLKVTRNDDSVISSGGFATP